jgi:hypothetical protein
VTRKFTTRVLDISICGVRLGASVLPLVGEEVEITLEPVQAFGAVVWSNDRECGICFEEELSLIQLEALRMKCGLPSICYLSAQERFALARAAIGR